MFLLKLTLDALLQLVASDASSPPGRSQTLLVTSTAIVLDKLRETIRLGFAGNQLLDKRNVDAHPKRNATGSNLVCVILGYNV